MLSLFVCKSHAQGITDSIPQFDLAKIAQVNQSDSYITFPTDIGNLEPLMFEANVNPSFVIRKRKDSTINGRADRSDYDPYVQRGILSS